jgi:ABC-type phosphate/phosphonate transport system ATPase subunit
MVSLSDFKSAKGFIVIFTCNHCPYAKKYEDRIIALDKNIKLKDIR